MPDINRVITNHTNEMSGWWKRVEYVNARKAFVKRHPVCIRCGCPCVTPGHSHEDYRDFETYLNAVISDKCDPLCSACNREERRNRRPCPCCTSIHKTNPDQPIHYITQDQQFCYSCSPLFNREKMKFDHEHAIRLKKDYGRRQYNQHHPDVMVPVNGKWVKIPR